MQADWHEKHILLKVAFPLSARNDKATFEIPYGTVERPTTRNTPAEQAQFEVPALRWADLSGLRHPRLQPAQRLANTATTPRTTCCGSRCCARPSGPIRNADQGHHEFTYSLYPHAGTWREALTVRQGYEVNYPLLATTTTRHRARCRRRSRSSSTQEDNVVITAIKKDEDDNSLIVRFYEWAGKKGDVHLTLPDKPPQPAWQTNLMEAVAGPLSLDASRQGRHRPNQPLRDQDGESAIRKTLKPFQPRMSRGSTRDSDLELHQRSMQSTTMIQIHVRNPDPCSSA